MAWVVSRLVALILLFGASGLLYHVAASDNFRITSVVVSGTRLLSSSEVEAAASVSGVNIFWLRQEEIARRLQSVPAIESVEAGAYLPNRVEVRIGERSPVAVWLSGDVPWLVDGEGRVLRSVPTPPALPALRDVGAPSLAPGASIDREALATLFRLQELLPRAAGLSPREFEYSADAGVTVIADSGLRVVFGRGDELEWKVTALGAVRRELERQGQRAELIDVRFKDRPYVR
ncbi:MAG: FtsQ-type POTRA domain-containing protein [Chloroflexota bacterium]|nr:FtsQ-type POTRA domain-containing protein [Chloroflexota bacterium]